ncbi:MAG: UDP-N-acetylglucosamine 1-carboxyvinyltransferase [Candidatus Portnoybacteria bacterium CG10_big_fil_rev_8_21_14_0_10_36_7]|uniref:UDP-N-acetylglucosamine 1-carboxyvinyltransferase n=1 Tax=Candidatus Portnoybacteria bacterium CG10_big_fil_rev_8_21_14_0_10_36_7 TaxID=1974812 RepID=A0A2M8KEM8_9BACT|nr:MAG: UDP-N-acetylglucosamine 1-carboxyvinyltransferase [Candidatus Portnoybacteria bacterium CG10_big_fil_rev_8_21_14_0_10_36_7]
MFGKLIIDGGGKLSGTISVCGAKNAATPILAASLLTSEPCEIDNVPKIEDLYRMIELMQLLGVEVRWIGRNKLLVHAKKIAIKDINNDIVCKMRSSILLWGALCGRVKKFSMNRPGGCIIGARTIAPHLEAFRTLGVKVLESEKGISFNSSEIKSTDLTLSEISVTATENAILTAVLAQGETIIRCAVVEPHTQDLCHFLVSMGAKISGIGSSVLVIKGVKKLLGSNYSLIPDPIEMGTFIALAGATKSNIIISNVVIDFIPMEMQKFREAGLKFEFINVKKSSWGYSLGSLVVKCPNKLKAIAKVHNMPFPGFAADNLPPFAVMATQAEGETLIYDWMYEGRMNYLLELQKMCAHVKILNQHESIITGPVDLKAMEITSFDLRAGASLLIAALVAKGKSEISDIYQIDRGYEEIEKRLVNLGAKINRI